MASFNYFHFSCIKRWNCRREALGIKLRGKPSGSGQLGVWMQRGIPVSLGGGGFLQHAVQGSSVSAGPAAGGMLEKSLLAAHASPSPPSPLQIPECAKAHLDLASGYLSLLRSPGAAVQIRSELGAGGRPYVRRTEIRDDINVWLWL